MGAQQREALDRSYRQSKIDGSTPAELRRHGHQSLPHAHTRRVRPDRIHFIQTDPSSSGASKKRV
jgi:hypothetical protein